MKIKEMIRAAADVPVIPYWAQLVSGLAMTGAQIVPEDLWDSIGKKLETEADELENELEDLKVEGFTIKENHARSEGHETWTVNLVERFTNENPGKTIWAIPVNELICLAQDDLDADDMVSITRMLFAGTEDELRAAIANWLKA